MLVVDPFSSPSMVVLLFAARMSKLEVLLLLVLKGSKRIMLGLLDPIEGGGEASCPRAGVDMLAEELPLP